MKFTKLATLALTVLVLGGCSLFQGTARTTTDQPRARMKAPPEPGRAFLLCVIDNTLPNHRTAMWQAGAVDDRGETLDIWFHREDYDQGQRPDLILLGNPYVYRGFCPGMDDETFRGLVPAYPQQPRPDREKSKKPTQPSMEENPSPQEEKGAS